MRCCILLSIVLLGALTSQAAGQPTPAPATPAAERPERTRHARFDDAIEDARKTGRPILFVAHATWCGPCRKLEVELHSPEVQAALAAWVLVRIDVDEHPDVMERYRVTSIPAMRVLDSSGQVLRSNTGYLPADEFLAWLAGDAAGLAELKNRPEVLDVTAATVPQLIALLANRDATRRELALRRLETSPDLSRVAVAEALIEGNLSTRLAALDILTAWHAPVDELDPWRPETLSKERLESIAQWAEEQPVAPPAARFTESELAAAREEVARLPTLEASDLDALGARLARYGVELLPAVRELRSAALNDRDRERLDWLRYRLSGSDELAVRWPDGLVRLASMSASTRQQAAGELSTLVTSGDERLLIELLGHPDAFVREMSLKALGEVGTSGASEQLTSLLSDPDPNVRVAVLKQLAEEPNSGVVVALAKYVAGEKDPALVSQAVRALRAIRGRKAVECLITLFKHDDWQVRAEAVEATGECLSESASYGFSAEGRADDELRADGYTALLDVLSDSDGFVVSRAVLALKEADLAISVSPLIKTGEKYPEFGGIISESLISGQNVRQKATPELRKWLTHADARLRAAAIKSLGEQHELDGETELVTALSDPDEKVRVAAADQILLFCGHLREPLDQAESAMRRPGGSSSFLAEAAGALFGGLFKPLGAETKVEVVVEQNPAPAPATDPPSIPSPSSVGPYEEWLARFRAGESRPPWLAKSIDPLSKMLASESENESISAALPLIALGQDRKALPLLRETVMRSPTMAQAAGLALPWLPWEQRRDLFLELKAVTSGSDQVARLGHYLIQLRDPRASALLWDMLADQSMTADAAGHIVQLLQTNHVMDSYGYYGNGPPPPPKDFDIDLVQNYAAKGSIWQRRAALALLHVLDDDPARTAAETILNDAAADPSLKADAFAISLLTTPQKRAREAAAEVIVAQNEALAPIGLAFLSRGESAISSMADGHMRLPGRRGNRVTSEESEQPALPETLSGDHLQPLRNSKNENTVADAAYVASLLGDASAVDAVIARWRKAGKGYTAAEWEKLAYQAIAAGDDSRYVPVLADIYATMKDDRQYQVKDFYWTIRSMTGPEILALRKRIREEIGMDQLR